MEKLTAKQQAFVEAILNPDENGKARTLADAYRSAYCAEDMSPRVIRNRASELRAHGGITVAIEKGMAKREREFARDAGNRRRGILARLDSIADDSENPAASRVAALKLLGEAEGGMFTHRVETTVSNATPETEADTLAELEETIREALH